jgi:LPS sulfotransferase NodH
MWGYLQKVVDRLREIPRYRTCTTEEVFRQAFEAPSYILIRRHDKIRQAISWVKAIQTDVWSVRGRPIHKRAQVKYDFAEIDDVVRTCEAHETGWKNFFADAGISYITVEYETLIAQFDDVVRFLLDAFGIVPVSDAELRRPQLIQQADSITDSWVSRYLMEKELR